VGSPGEDSIRFVIADAGTVHKRTMERRENRDIRFIWNILSVDQ
jgi:hypothetical protein